MQIIRHFSIFAIFSLFLTACGSNPQSYITAKKEPIVNIEAAINNVVQVTAKSDKLHITNMTNEQLNVAYKLFWYDQNGVSQFFADNQESSGWQNVWLKAQESRAVSPVKPTDEAVNYRVYLRGSR